MPLQHARWLGSLPRAALPLLALGVVALRGRSAHLAHDPLEIRLRLSAGLGVVGRFTRDETDLIHHLVDQRAEARAKATVAVGLFGSRRHQRGVCGSFLPATKLQDVHGYARASSLGQRSSSVRLLTASCATARPHNAPTTFPVPLYAPAAHTPGRTSSTIGSPSAVYETSAAQR